MQAGYSPSTLAFGREPLGPELAAEGPVERQIPKPQEQT